MHILLMRNMHTMHMHVHVHMHMHVMHVHVHANAYARAKDADTHAHTNSCNANNNTLSKNNLTTHKEYSELHTHTNIHTCTYTRTGLTNLEAKLSHTITWVFCTTMQRNLTRRFDVTSSTCMQRVAQVCVCGTYICICVCVVYMYLCVCVCVCMSAYMNKCMYVQWMSYICTYMCTYYTHTHTTTRKYLYTHTYTRTYTGDTKGEQLALNSIGIDWHKLGDFDKAIDSHNQHLQIADIPGKFVVSKS